MAEDYNFVDVFIYYLTSYIYKMNRVAVPLKIKPFYTMLMFLLVKHKKNLYFAERMMIDTKNYYNYVDF